MKIAFYFTLTCNARCDHCITLAGPKVRRKMTLADAMRVVHRVASVPALDGIVFTGGENFIHKDELLQLVTECTALGVKSEVITNAFWAIDVPAAVRCLEPFRDAGLATLRISIDRYHLPYVAISRVHAALEAMREVGFERHVTCVIEQRNAAYKQSNLEARVAPYLDEMEEAEPALAERLGRELRADWPPDLLDLLATYGLDADSCFLIDDVCELGYRKEWNAGALAAWIAHAYTLVQYQFLATEGRGRTLLGAVGEKHIDDSPDVACNSVISTPTITPEGHLFPCCSAWVNHPNQAIGNVRDTPLEELLDRAASDPVALFMYYQGPAALIRYLREKPLCASPVVDGAPHRLLPVVEPLPDRYTHTCHHCGTLLERYPRPHLEAAIRAFYHDYPWKMIVPTRGFDLFSTAETAPL